MINKAIYIFVCILYFVILIAGLIFLVRNRKQNLHHTVSASIFNENAEINDQSTSFDESGSTLYPRTNRLFRITKKIPSNLDTQHNAEDNSAFIIFS